MFARGSTCLPWGDFGWGREGLASGLLSLYWQCMDLGGYYFPALASTESLLASLFTRGMSVSQQWEMRTFNSEHLRQRKKALAMGVSGNPAAGFLAVSRGHWSGEAPVLSLAEGLWLWPEGQVHA